MFAIGILPVLPVILNSGATKDEWAPIKMGLGLASGFAMLGILLSLLTASLGLSANSSQTFFAILMGLAGLLLIAPSGNGSEFLNQLAQLAQIADGGRRAKQFLGAILIIASGFVLTRWDIWAMEQLTQILPESWIRLSNRY